MLILSSTTALHKDELESARICFYVVLYYTILFWDEMLVVAEIQPDTLQMVLKKQIPLNYNWNIRNYYY